MFNTLPGFREFYPEQCYLRNHIFKIWRNTARRFNFQEYDAPVLEPLELFTAKSGDEIVSQLFAFTDQGERQVALRPEMTPSLARLVGSKINAMRKPVKWFAIGENYRYERPQKGRLRAFYQLNCDILGDDSVFADAEAIALLIESFVAFGLGCDDFCIRLSDRDLWVYFLKTQGLSEDQIVPVLGVIDRLEKLPPEKLQEELKPFFADMAEDFFKKAMELAEVNDFEKLKAYMATHASSDEAIAGRIAQWQELLGILDSMGLGHFIRIDLKVVRGLAYYTGFVFEAFQIKGKARALAGGGRYDNLIKKLGGPDTHAVGFAIGDVTLTNLLEESGLLPKYWDGPQFFVVCSDIEAQKVALKDVMALRRAGLAVEYPFKIGNMGKQFKLADQLSSRHVLVYGSEELKAGKVKVKTLSSGEEVELSRENLVEQLLEL